MIETFIAFIFASVTLAHKGDLALKELGEKEYLLIKSKSTLPQHGACWYDAMRAIKDSCEKLNDHEHSLLALRLANCFLEDSGHVTYDCHLSETEDERRECINNMSDRAFGVYNEFYTHTTHICFFLNHEIWQTETENTIKHLYRASSHMKEQLLEASEVQGAMLESQKEGLRMQNELLDHGKELGTVMRSSAETVSNMIDDFKESTSDQRELLYQIFSHIQIFQNWIISEISWFQSIIYYTVSCVLGALFSSSKRTADARISLFTILSLNVIIERMLVQYYNNATHSVNDKAQLIHITWLFRKGALTLCILILFYTYYSYKDEQMENYKMLRRIECQLNCLYEVNQPVRYSERLALRRLKETRQKDVLYTSKR